MCHTEKDILMLACSVIYWCLWLSGGMWNVCTLWVLWLFLQTFRETIGEIFVTPSDAQTSFLASLRSLFSDGIVNWGRVVALFAFSGSLAAYCVEREMPFLVNQVIDWTTAYISTNLASWIHDNGGWVSRLRVLFVCSQVHTVSFWPSCSASELRCSVTHVHTADYVVRVS